MRLGGHQITRIQRVPRAQLTIILKATPVTKPGAPVDVCAEEMGHARSPACQKHGRARFLLTRLGERYFLADPQELAIDFATDLFARCFSCLVRNVFQVGEPQRCMPAFWERYTPIGCIAAFDFHQLVFQMSTHRSMPFICNGGTLRGDLVYVVPHRR